MEICEFKNLYALVLMPSHKGAGLSPCCSSYNQAPCLWPVKVVQHAPNAWAPATMRETLS